MNASTDATVAAADAAGDERTPRVARRSLAATVRAFFGHASPRVLLVQLVVALALRAAVGPLRPRDALIVLAVAAWWPLQEWLLHRVVLHARPRTILGWHVDTAPARAHRRHHRDPRDPRFVVLPGRSMLVLVPVNLVFWWAVSSTWASALTGIAALGGAALVYEWIHYLCHAPYRVRSGYLKRIRAHHALHHFRNEAYWHSFTVPALDRLLGTGPNPAKVTLSPTCRSLGIDEG